MSYRPTLAVDFDGTLHEYTSAWTCPEEVHDGPVEGAIEWLNRMAQEFDVVICSTRAEEEKGRQAIWDWLGKYGFILWDDGRPRITVTSSKPKAVLNVDDRVWLFMGPGSFPTADEVRSFKPWNKA